MKLFTINATPERYDVTKDENVKRHKNYAITVSKVLKAIGVDGFTIQKAQGYWQGKPEKSYIITVAHDNSDDIDKVAELLRDAYNQDSVMVTYPDNSVKFI